MIHLDIYAYRVTLGRSHVLNQYEVFLGKGHRGIMIRVSGVSGYMKKILSILLVGMCVLILTSCFGAREQGKDNMLSIIQTDNYNATINANGTLTFTDKTGNAILDSSPQFYFDYGDKSVRDVSLTNPSFEADSNSDGIPDGWTVDKTYIRQSDERVSDGKKSLKFNMTAADAAPRQCYSPFMEIHKDSSYSINLDVYVNSFTSGTVSIITYGYSSADGTGNYNSSLSTLVPTTNIRSWNTLSFDWNPPFDAQSFKCCLYSENKTIATIFFDNLKVSEVTKNYQSNGDNITTNVVTSGNDVTITATDDTNSSITVAHKYELNKHLPNIKYTATLVYKKDVIVAEERFDFKVPQLPRSIMKRDMQFEKFDQKKREYYSDLYSPKVVKFDNGLSFLDDDTMQSMRLRAIGKTSQCSFYSDNQVNHPFKYYVKNGAGNKADISSQSRKIGDSYTSSLTFSVSPGTTPESLIKTRQPYGYHAVLVLTNHADTEKTETINAIAYGTEDTTSPDYGSKGIVGRGLGWTKSVFVAWQNAPYNDLNDAGFKSLHDQLYKDRVEIIANTITDDTDTRTEVENGLKRLSGYGARNWIDADAANGTKNWEDIASQGTIKGDANYILDLLDAQGYEYAWSYIDMTISGYDLNMLNPSVVGANTSFFYYNNRIDDDPSNNTRIYLWSTLNTKKKPELYYTNANVDSLISQRGVHIGHEYMGGLATENHAWYVNPSNGKISIFPAFDDELAYIASKRDAGLLWTPTMAEFGDYLKLQKSVSISFISSGTYKVTNNNSESINGLTLLAESNVVSVNLDGRALSLSGGSYNGNEVILPTLSPGQTVVLLISYRTQP